MAAQAGLADVVKTILQKGEQVDVRTNVGGWPRLEPNLGNPLECAVITEDT